LFCNNQLWWWMMCFCWRLIEQISRYLWAYDIWVISYLFLKVNNSEKCVNAAELVCSYAVKKCVDCAGLVVWFVFKPGAPALYYTTISVRFHQPSLHHYNQQHGFLWLHRGLRASDFQMGSFPVQSDFSGNKFTPSLIYISSKISEYECF
jgi:hypothetical protein